MANSSNYINKSFDISPVQKRLEHLDKKVGVNGWYDNSDQTHSQITETPLTITLFIQNIKRKEQKVYLSQLDYPTKFKIPQPALLPGPLSPALAAPPRLSRQVFLSCFLN